MAAMNSSEVIVQLYYRVLCHDMSHALLMITGVCQEFMPQDVDVQIKREVFQGPGPNGIDMQCAYLFPRKNLKLQTDFNPHTGLREDLMSEDKLMHVVDLKLANISSNDRHHPTKRILDFFLLHTSQSFQEFGRHRSCSTHQDNVAKILPIFLDRLERAQTRWLQTSMPH